MNLRLVLFAALILLCTGCKKDGVVSVRPTKIDSLRTDQQVKDFLVSIDPALKNYQIMSLTDFKRNKLDSLNGEQAKKRNALEHFVKTDLDQNGYTDLLVIGDDHSCLGNGGSCSFSPLLLMNFGKKIEIHPIMKGISYSRIVPVFGEIDGVPVLTVYDTRATNGKEYYDRPERVDLVYKFGDLIEYNPNPVVANIEKIEFRTSGCYGPCPVYDLVLAEDSVWTFTARRFNFNDHLTGDYQSIEGKFQAEADKEVFSSLCNLLNYIDFSHLKDRYSVSHTDDETADLKITYNDGKVKLISDYGMTGTFGLNLVYEHLAKLRFDRKWTDENGKPAPRKPLPR